jgi:hypothetical protein
MGGCGIKPVQFFIRTPLGSEIDGIQQKTNRLLEAAAERYKLPTDVLLVSTRKQEIQHLGIKQ